MTYIKDGNLLLPFFLLERESIGFAPIPEREEVVLVVRLAEFPPQVYPFKSREELEWFVSELHRMADEVWLCTDG